MPKAKLVPYSDFAELSPSEMAASAEAFASQMQKRRSVRQFARRPVERGIITACIAAAHSAPSGANMQPWHFAVVSDPETKAKIREGAEHEERQFYDGRAGGEWLQALEPIGTGPTKPFLQDAPYLIVVFQKNYAITSDQQRQNHYYVTESVGIATGILIAALHRAGLATLIHTPRPMGFLRRILQRPANERACMIVVTGYPALDAMVPILKKKQLDEVVSYF